MFSVSKQSINRWKQGNCWKAVTRPACTQRAQRTHSAQRAVSVLEGAIYTLSLDYPVSYSRDSLHVDPRFTVDIISITSSFSHLSVIVDWTVCWAVVSHCTATSVKLVAYPINSRLTISHPLFCLHLPFWYSPGTSRQWRKLWVMWISYHPTWIVCSVKRVLCVMFTYSKCVFGLEFYFYIISKYS